MARLSQVGIALGALGVVLMLMGLFPGVTGLDPTPGIGLLQIVALLIGFSWFIFGALIYVKYTFYINTPATLTQSIGTRLAMTGLVLAAMMGLADALGYGSHGPQFNGEAYLGQLQAAGIIVSYILSSIGVLVYAVAGHPELRADDDDEDVDADTVDDKTQSKSVQAAEEKPQGTDDQKVKPENHKVTLNGQDAVAVELARHDDT